MIDNLAEEQALMAQACCSCPHAPRPHALVLMHPRWAGGGLCCPARGALATAQAAAVQAAAAQVAAVISTAALIHIDPTMEPAASAQRAPAVERRLSDDGATKWGSR